MTKVMNSLKKATSNVQAATFRGVTKKMNAVNFRAEFAERGINPDDVVESER